MTKSKEQKPDEQNQTPVIEISPSKYKLLLLYDLLIRLTKASHPGAKYEPPISLEGLFLLKRAMEENKISTIMNLPTYPSIKNKTPKEILLGIEQSLYMIENQDEKLILTCLKCITDLMILKRDFEVTMTDDEFIRFMMIEDIVKARSYEALGYWTAKVEKKKIAKDSQETKQQQEEIKEKYIIEEWIKIIKNSTDKKILEHTSKNELARTIKEIVFPLLKDKKTATGSFVLKRNIDETGNLEYGGLSIDTIIRIMKNTKSDKFKFNPFKK